jgi:hypothetical protein
MQPFGSATQFPLNVPTGETTQGGPVEESVLIPAGTTTTQTAVQLGAVDFKSLALVVNVTAGTSVTVTVTGVTASGYTYTLLTSAALAPTSTTALTIGPGLPVTANVSANTILPRFITVTATVNTAATFGVDYILSY